MLRVGAVEAIQERRNFEQPRAVLDEVLVDDLGAAEGTYRQFGVHDQDAFFADDAERSASIVLRMSMLLTMRSVRISWTSKGWPIPLRSMIVRRPPRCSWNSASP